jgi:hypothetical protein
MLVNREYLVIQSVRTPCLGKPRLPQMGQIKWELDTSLSRMAQVSRRHIPCVASEESESRYRHLKSKRVLCLGDGSPLTQDVVGEYVRKAGRKANLPASGAHRLRHTFCSHLAMRGAPARAIQELAGHQDLMTTQRYMHLSPSAVETRFDCWSTTGRLKAAPTYEDILETKRAQIAKSQTM